MLLLAAAGRQSDLLMNPEGEALALRGEKKMAPFHAVVNQWYIPSAGFSDCGGFPVPVRFEFEGNATHLGRVTGWGEGYACTFDPATGVFHGDFTGAYVAANGDELWFEGWVEFNFYTGAFIGSESQFTGGTGRWVNATGGITSTAQPTESPNITLYIHDGEK